MKDHERPQWSPWSVRLYEALLVVLLVAVLSCYNSWVMAIHSLRLGSYMTRLSRMWTSLYSLVSKYSDICCGLEDKKNLQTRAISVPTLIPCYIAFTRSDFISFLLNENDWRLKNSVHEFGSFKNTELLIIEENGSESHY
jgi:hypothetical protein